jgi:hypothetical protein
MAGFRSGRLLRLEPLDCRALPSVTVVEADGILTVQGDQRANTIEITDAGTGDADAVTVVADGETFTSTAAVTKIVVRSGGQADTVSYNLGADLTAGVTRTVQVYLGNQHDSFSATLAGLAADSTLTVDVYGGNGHDDLSVTQSGELAGRLDVRLLGQNGKDSVFAGVDGTVSGELDLVLNGGNGVDFLWAEVTASAAPTEPTDPTEPTEPAGDVFVEVLGGNGKDDLTLLVDGADSLGMSVFEINGGRGKDNFNFTDDVVTVLDAEAH